MYRRLSWLWHAGKRTLLAFVPQLLRVDDAFAHELLSDCEYQLFQMMDIRDRFHAVEVMQALVMAYPQASNELKRAALLHDLGKSVRPYNVWERILSHLYTPQKMPAEPIMTGLQGVWQMHRHHADIGARWIIEAGGSGRVAELVARHDKPQDDEEARMLYDIDSRY